MRNKHWSNQYTSYCFMHSLPSRFSLYKDLALYDFFTNYILIPVLTQIVGGEDVAELDV